MFFTDSEIEKCTATKGDLLVCEGGDFGRAAIWPFDYDIRIQNHIHRLRAYAPVCTEYYYYIFYLYKHVGWIGGKGIGIQGLSSNALHALPFPLPPVEEQKRIVDIIRKIDPITEKYEIAEAKLDALNIGFPDQLKKSILQMAVQGKLVPQDPADEPASVLLERIRTEKEQLIREGKIKRDKNESVIFRRDNSHYEKRSKTEIIIDGESPFDIPETWTWCRLRSLLVKASTGPFGSMLHREDYTQNGVPLINPANIVNGQISEVGIKHVSDGTAQRLSAYRLNIGDVVIGRRGEMGRSAVVRHNNGQWLCGTGCFYVTTYDGFLSDYLVFLLKAPYLQSALLDNSVGTTMNNLNHSILSELLIPLPPTSEQLRIMQEYVHVCSLLPS